MTRSTPLVAALLLLLGLAGSCSVHAQQWSTQRHELRIDGRERTYRVFAPDEAGEPMPAMLVLHGGLGNAAGVERYYAMNEVAEREGFVAVYPNGERIGRIVLRNRRTWNAGACCGPAAANDVDDVAFIIEILEAIASEYSLDTNRIYVSGMSNGAMMTYRLVCEAGEHFAAAIPVAGVLLLEDCAGGADVPVLHIHGALDDNVPIGGGVGPRALADIDYPSLETSLGWLARVRDCAAPAVATDDAGITRWRYTCEAGAPIEVVILPDAAHTWPGATARPLQRNTWSGEFSASETAWAFARDHARAD